jgi:DNA-binding transcriptional MerR regulator
MVLYICNKCNKNFTRKQAYDIHINRKNPCILDENINKIKELEKTKQLEEKNKQLEEKNRQLEVDNIQLKDRIKELESENKTLNNLVNKCFENNKTIKTKTNNNTTNNINNTINNINVNLVPFGMENIDDLTPEEKKIILNSGMFCSVMCAKKLNCNPRLPQYHNISFTNLRSNDAKIYDKDKTWKTVDKEDLFETVIPRRIDDVNLLIENEDIKISPYMDNLVKKGTDEDEVVKNTKIKKRFHRTVYDFDKSKEKKKLT